MASITQRRRGIYLARVEVFDAGVENWDAFGTLAEARRWCAAFFDHKRLRWEQAPSGAWHAWVGE